MMADIECQGTVLIFEDVEFQKCFGDLEDLLDHMVALQNSGKVPVQQRKEQNTLFVIPNEDGFSEGSIEGRKDCNIITNFNLAGLIDYKSLDWIL